MTGLWLIGLWQRSIAAERIKRMRGNQDAVASAYSLDDYRIADDLGGEAAMADLRDRAWARGIRLASDMVPNHMGIDSRWVIDHPEWFLALPEPPYPAYTYTGADLSPDERVGVVLEDHYWNDSDAAVTFKRFDRWTRRRALRLPRQRRHELPVERHGPARLPAAPRSASRSSGPSSTSPGASRSSASTPRWSSPGKPHPAAVVAAARRPATASRRAPSTP